MGDAIETRTSGPTALAPHSFEEARRFAASLAKAQGFVPREMLGKPHAILAAIMTGAELGIGPMQSLRSIYILDGTPMLAADLMLAIAIRSGVRHKWLEMTDKVARIRLTRDGHDPHEHSFTIEEAQRAGLAKRNNWRSYAPAMLRARCLSAALRAFCPDVLGSGVYVEGEIVPDDPPRADVSASADGPAPAEEDEPVDAEWDEAGDEAGDEEVEAPRSLTDCETAEELQAWCSVWGPRVASAGRLDSVEDHATRIGVAVEDVRQWCGSEGA